MRTFLVGLLIGTLSIALYAQGKIVVANDEWTLSDTGYSNAPGDTQLFVSNLTQWFTGGNPGTFLAYTNNFGLTQSQLVNQMASLGHTYTISTALPLDATLLQNYDAVFLGGYYTNINIPDLISYVQNGGCVYVCAGTGVGGAANEANAWNPFLNAFGLAFQPAYNGIGGNISISSSHPIFVGVNQLYQNNGNSIVDLNPSDPANEVLVTFNNQGLYAVYIVPEPTSMVALISGVGLLLGARRRAK